MTFDGDDDPGTVHLGVRDGDDCRGRSRRGYRARTATSVPCNSAAWPPPRICRARGLGAILIESGCQRAATVAPIVWARARDTALPFYLRHGFVVDGDGFVDETTGLPHHVIVRRLS